jgi:aryl-alcohol dehydrogenase-like predicted oxidoreductase
MLPAADSYPQSMAYGTPKSDEERFKVFDKLYSDGHHFWDTADLYGDSEDLLGTLHTLYNCKHC